MRKLLLLALLIAAGAPTASAQGARDSVDWAVRLEPSSVAPGEAFVALIEAHIRPGWKMYATDSPGGSPLKIEFEEAAWASVSGRLRQATPNEGYDPFLKAQVRYFRDRASFELPMRAGTVAQGSYELSGRAVFMICDDRMCLPPTPVPLKASLSIGTGADSGVSPPDDRLSAEGGSGAESPRGEALDGSSSERNTQGESRPLPSLQEATPAGDFGSGVPGGMWAFVLLAVGAGFAALLTPCVFPMIPLTISYFTKHSGNRSESIRMAVVYGAAIVITFTGLGVLTALLVGAAGAQTIAANPWINLFIGAVFVVFALSLLGLFELRLPSSVLNFFNRQSSERGGYLGVLFMGLTLTLVSFSCTAPFVGGLLAATVQGQWAYPVVGMLLFSATFALPFFLFALFPKGLGALPQAGAWMNCVKVVLGFVELAAALKFLSNADLIWGWQIITRPLAIALIVVIFALAGLYLLGKLRLSHEPAVEQVGVMRLMVAIAFFGISLYMIPGLLGAPLNALDAYLPPRQGSDVSLIGFSTSPGTGTASHAFPWHEEIAPAFEEARQSGKPVFVDFTGYTCTNCREMEANVFPRAEVASRLTSNFILLRLYTDDLDRGPDFQRYQLRTTGTVALPTYAIIDATSERVLAKVSGIISPKNFVAFLDSGSGPTADEGLVALRAASPRPTMMVARGR